MQNILKNTLSSGGDGAQRVPPEAAPGVFFQITKYVAKNPIDGFKISTKPAFQNNTFNQGRQLPALANLFEPSGLAVVSIRDFSRTYDCACFEASKTPEPPDPPNDKRRLSYTGLCLALGLFRVIGLIFQVAQIIILMIRIIAEICKSATES